MKWPGWHMVAQSSCDGHFHCLILGAKPFYIYILYFYYDSIALLGQLPISDITYKFLSPDLVIYPLCELLFDPSMGSVPKHKVRLLFVRLVRGGRGENPPNLVDHA